MTAREGRLQLEHAAGIAGSDHVGAKLRNEFGFAVAERSRSVGLHEIVDSRGTAADRKSTRLNSSHTVISYAVFCLKKKKEHANSSTNRTRNTRLGTENRKPASKL